MPLHVTVPQYIFISMGGHFNHHLTKEITYITLLYYTSCNGEYEVTYSCMQSDKFPNNYVLHVTLIWLYNPCWYSEDIR